MIRKSGDRLPPSSPERRHFMAIVAAGAGKLSTIAVSSALLATAFKAKDANARSAFFPEALPVPIPTVSDEERLFGRPTAKCPSKIWRTVLWS